MWQGLQWLFPELMRALGPTPPNLFFSDFWNFIKIIGRSWFHSFFGDEREKTFLGVKGWEWDGDIERFVAKYLGFPVVYVIWPSNIFSKNTNVVMSVNTTQIMQLMPIYFNFWTSQEKEEIRVTLYKFLLEAKLSQQFLWVGGGTSTLPGLWGVFSAPTTWHDE